PSPRRTPPGRAKSGVVWILCKCYDTCGIQGEILVRHGCRGGRSCSRGQSSILDNRPNRPIRVILAKPRGFCAGVERAIEIVERALRKYGRPVYVRHEIVHNKHVVEDLRSKGAVFVEELDEIPAGAVTVFSAHGVSEAVE